MDMPKPDRSNPSRRFQSFFTPAQATFHFWNSPAEMKIALSRSTDHFPLKILPVTMRLFTTLLRISHWWLMIYSVGNNFKTNVDTVKLNNLEEFQHVRQGFFKKVFHKYRNFHTFPY
jgi:hypothetical protein